MEGAGVKREGNWAAVLLRGDGVEEVQGSEELVTCMKVGLPWKPPPCSPVDEWINKIQCMYTTEYYSATRKKETLLFVTTRMGLEDITLSGISQTEKDKSHLYVQSKKAEFIKTESIMVVARGWRWGHGNDIENTNLWVFLVVQWLRICLETQGTLIWSLVWEDPAYHGATKPITTTTKPILSFCAPLKEKPLKREALELQLESSPPLTTTRESLQPAVKTQYSQKFINNSLENKIWTCNENIQKSWRSNALYFDYYMIIIRFAERLDLSYSHYKKELVIMWYYKGVSKCYNDNHSAIYKCIQTCIKKPRGCPPWIYTMLHVRCISGKRKLGCPHFAGEEEVACEFWGEVAKRWATSGGRGYWEGCLEFLSLGLLISALRHQLDIQVGKWKQRRMMIWREKKGTQRKETNEAMKLNPLQSFLVVPGSSSPFVSTCRAQGGDLGNPLILFPNL